MTWKEFKTLLEKRGVKDTDEIDYIDVDEWTLKVVSRVRVQRETHADGSTTVLVQS